MKKRSLQEEEKYQIEHNWKEYLYKICKKPKFYIITSILGLIVLVITGHLYSSIGVMMVSILLLLTQWINVYISVDEKARSKYNWFLFKVKYKIKKFLNWWPDKDEDDNFK